MNIIKTELNNIKTVLLETNKFKTINFELAFINEYKKENALADKILMRILSISSKKYNTKKLFNNIIFDLYDVNLYSFMSYNHLTQTSIISLSMINPKYIEDNDLLVKCIDFLKEVLLEPNITDEKILLEEKNKLIQHNNKLYNNKDNYSIHRLLRTMSQENVDNNKKEETLYSQIFNDNEEINKINIADIIEAYNRLINKCKICLYIIGDIKFEQIEDKFSFLKYFTSNTIKYNYQNLDENNITKVNEVTEIQNINQSKICMGFRLPIIDDNNRIAISVFDSMFGGMYSSTLVQNVREKYNYAYTIYSSYLKTDRIFYVFAGVDGNKYEKVKNIVLNELEKYKNGNFEDSLLEVARTDLIDSLYNLFDYYYFYFDNLINTELTNKERTLEDVIEEYKKVTKKDIIELANKIKLDTVYLLTNK